MLMVIPGGKKKQCMQTIGYSARQEGFAVMHSFPQELFTILSELEQKYHWTLDQSCWGSI